MAVVPHGIVDPILLSTPGGIVRASEFRTYLKDVQRREGPLSESVQRSLLEEFKTAGVLFLEARAQGLVQGNTIERKQAAVEQLLLRTTVPTEPPSFREVEELYAREPSLCESPEKLGLSQILLPVAEKAASLAWKAKRDPTRFAELARENSIGPEAPSGGLMGTFAAGQLLPELEAATSALAVGEVSPVVHSSLGYHIFHLDFRHPASRLSVAECAPKLEAMVLRQKSERQQQQLISHLLQQAKVNHEVPDLFLP